MFEKFRLGWAGLGWAQRRLSASLSSSSSASAWRNTQPKLRNCLLLRYRAARAAQAGRGRLGRPVIAHPAPTIKAGAWLGNFVTRFGVRCPLFEIPFRRSAWRATAMIVDWNHVLSWDKLDPSIASIKLNFHSSYFRLFSEPERKP